MTVKNTSIALFFALVAPFLLTVNAYLVYVAYIAAILSVIKFTFPGRMPILFWMFLIFCLAISFVHSGSMPTILNLAALVLGASYALSVGYALYCRPPRDLLYLMLLVILLGFVYSELFSSFLDIVSPVSRYFAIGRLMILSPDTAGHSILIEASSVVYALSMSGVITKHRISLSLVSGMLLGLSGSSTSLAVLSVITLSFLIERVPGYTFRVFAYASVISLAVWITLEHETANQYIGMFRSTVSGQDLSVYRHGDYSAGRFLLNALLLEVANGAPIFGEGRDHPVIQYGISIVSGVQEGASSESPLRLAAQFGYPLFCLFLFAFSLPFLKGLLMTGAQRRFFVSIGLAILVSSATNGSFSVPQSSTFIIYGPIVFLAYFGGFRREFIESSIRSDLSYEKQL